MKYIKKFNENSNTNALENIKLFDKKEKIRRLLNNLTLDELDDIKTHINKTIDTMIESIISDSEKQRLLNLNRIPIENLSDRDKQERLKRLRSNFK